METESISSFCSTYNSSFTSQTMLTCIGNKRKLVKNIYDIVKELQIRIGTNKLNIVDGFAGSNVVARMLAPLSNNIYTNDLENYSYLMSKCFLETPSPENQVLISQHLETMNQLAESGPYIEDGIISRLYAPKDTNNIKKDERCFYTRENALIIDTLRKYIEDEVPIELQNYCLVPLLIKASIHTNTAGVFKGFYKKGEIGHFGGAAENALSRIKKDIKLELPVWLDEEDAPLAHCFNEDIGTMIVKLPSNVDIIYLDPPYNQHPYGSNYFMLNVISSNIEPKVISKVSGIPVDWNKSAYNKHGQAVEAMTDLLQKCLEKSKYVILSYNNEGIITLKDWEKIFEPYQVEKREIKYDTFKGCRNLKERSDKVIEIMYIIHLS
jgi:adenine-specific DNA-methyltransferase